MADLRGQCVTGLLSRALCPGGDGGEDGALGGVLRIVECLMTLPTGTRRTLARRAIDTLADLRDLDCLQSAIGACDPGDRSRAFRIMATLADNPAKAMALEAYYADDQQAVRDATAWSIRQGATSAELEKATSEAGRQAATSPQSTTKRA